MWFFDDALATASSWAPAVAQSSSGDDTATSAPAVTSAAEAPLFVIDETTNNPSSLSAPVAWEAEITFFDAPPMADSTVTSAEVAPVQHDISLDLASLSGQIATPDQATSIESVAPTDDVSISSDVIIPSEEITSESTPSYETDAPSRLAEAPQSGDTVLAMQTQEIEDPATILARTVDDLKRSEQALEDQATQLESQAQSYHEQAAMLTQAEESAKSQAERLHKKADELESTIQGISKEQEKFSS